MGIINAKESTRKDLFSKKSDKRREIIDNYVKNAKTERLKFATQFSEKEPITTSYSEWAFYMDLTAEEINILAEKGGYSLRFSDEPVGLKPE